MFLNGRDVTLPNGCLYLAGDSGCCVVCVVVCYTSKSREHSSYLSLLFNVLYVPTIQVCMHTSVCLLFSLLLLTLGISETMSTAVRKRVRVEESF